MAIAAATQTGDQGLTIGRTAAILAGLPRSVPGFAIDRMCAGAMTAVTTVASGIAVGAYDAAIAGGVEHMGHHPMGEGADPNPRFVSDRLVDPSALNMGSTAENLHDRYPQLTKQRADAFAVASQEKYAKALANGKIDPDLVPVATRSVEQGWGLAGADEMPRPGTTLEALQTLRTPFRPHGRVTAGNASGPDRRGHRLPAGRRRCRRRTRPAGADADGGLRLRRRRARRPWAPGPIPATEKALAKAGLTIDDIGLIEINEAFAVQVLAFTDHFGLADDDERINQYGGAIAMGHPLASSGVRLMTQLARQFAERPDVRYGLTTMCVGLGMGGTVIWENPHHSARHQRPSQHPSRCRDHRERPVTTAVNAIAKTRATDDLTAFAADEVVTHAFTRVVEVPTPGAAGGTVRIALITLDNGRDHTRPNTLGPARPGQPGRGDHRRARGRPRRHRGHRQAVHLRRRRRPVADRQGHRPVRRRWRSASSASGCSAGWAPAASRRSRSSTALAMGGGIELALHCDYRTLASQRRRSSRCPRCSSASCPAGVAPSCCRGSPARRTRSP